MKSLRATEEGVNKEETFNSLADAFTLNSEVTGLFLKGPMENLQDFRYYFAEEEEIEILVEATLGTEILDSNQWRNRDSYWQLWDQIGKVTDAWKTIRRVCRKNENHIVGAAMQANKPIDVHTLRAAKLQFWKRYKTKHPMEVSPSNISGPSAQIRYKEPQQMKKSKATSSEVSAT